MNRTPARSFLRPRPELRPYVQFSFIFPDYRDQPSMITAKRVPTGRATIFFAHDVRSLSLEPRSNLFFEGPQSEGFSVTSEYGEVVGVKLRVGAARAILGMSARELRNIRVPLEVLWGQAGALLAEQMANARSAFERLRLLEEALVRRSSADEGNDGAAVLIAKAIEERRGFMRISELCQRFGYSQRGLLYKFHESTGLSPKQYARIVRLRACIAQLESRSTGWAALASECGFYDQAHMVREFNALLGQSPTLFMHQLGDYSPVIAGASGSESLPSCERNLYHSLGFVSEWARARPERHAAPRA